MLRRTNERASGDMMYGVLGDLSGMAAFAGVAQGHGMGWRGLRNSLLSGVALIVLSGGARADQAAVAGTGAPAGAPQANADVITVTAQRRVQNLQDVPVSIQVLSGATLKKLNIENFDDLLAQLPNVTAAGTGPGQENIYVRGLSLGTGGSQESGVIGSFPNVAVYLDDQSAQVPGRNLDIYAVDLQQVEVLEGPQGTLFGSGAEAGVLRYITNKPDLSKFGGNMDIGGAGTVHGAPSGNIDATVNIPVIPDKLAVRLTAYDDVRGGYINNVPGTFARQATDIGIHYAGYTNNIPGPPNGTNSVNNYGSAKQDTNPVRYEGFRGEAAWKFNDDWSALLTESAQRMASQGVFYEEPYTSGSNPVKLPDLSVQTFEPSYDYDTFENTALTINGRLGVLNLVYDGAYLIRHVSQQQDYTNYARGVYADYYQCQPANPAKGTPAKCFSPAATWQDHEQDTHLSQEFRVSTPDDWRLRAIGGFYYEDFTVAEQTDFNYLTDTGAFAPVGPPNVTGVTNPNTRSPNTGFFTDATRGYTQYALFGSADFDIIPKVLTATFGTRWYDFYDYEQGAYAGSFGCSTFYGYAGPTPCLSGAHSLTAKNLQTRTYGFKNRANLTYKVTPDIMLYYTYSEGYRPPGFNRKPPVDRINGEAGDDGYNSDTLTNHEIGYKAALFDHRLILDGAFYYENWNNTQASLFAPGVFGNLAFTVNGPDFRVLGTELQATGRPTDDLTLNTSVALNDSKQLNAPGIAGANGGTLPGSSAAFAPSGGTLGLAPAFKLVARARYEFDELPYAPYFQLVLSHTSHERSNIGGILRSPGANGQDILISNYELGQFTAFFQNPITKLDVSMGATYGNWSGNIYCNNITNERGQQFITGAQFVESIVVDRPLTAGVKLSYRF
jgi:outer membrane receptor protein involved in Fe transport